MVWLIDMSFFLIIIISMIILACSLAFIKKLIEEKRPFIAFLEASIVFLTALIGLTTSKYSGENKAITDNGKSTVDQTVSEMKDSNDNKEDRTEEVLVNIGEDNVVEETIQTGETLSEEEEDYNENETRDTDEKRVLLSFIGEKHDPHDIINDVSVVAWDPEIDEDIAGRKYFGGIKISFSNILAALDPGGGVSEEFVSEVHFAVTELAKNANVDEGMYRATFVVHKDSMNGASTASASVIVDGDEVYHTGEITCVSLNLEPFEIDLRGKTEVVIKTNCHQTGNTFVLGMVESEEY